MYCRARWHCPFARLKWNPELLSAPKTSLSALLLKRMHTDVDWSRTRAGAIMRTVACAHIPILNKPVRFHSFGALRSEPAQN